MPALSNGTFTWAASFECRLASYRRSGCTSHTRERYERWAGLLRSVAVISVNCSASSSRPGSVRSVSGTGQAVLVSSMRVAAAACNVTPIVVRRWFARGWLPQPPWTLRQIHEVRDNDAGRRLRGRGAAHGTDTRWTHGCNCGLCCKAKADAVRAGDRGRAHKRLPPGVRQQLLDAIYAGRPLRATVIDLGLTSNRVWGLTKTDEHWAAALAAALVASRRDDLKHDTGAAYVQGCVCSDCRAHQRIRMDRREQGELASLSEPVQWLLPRSPRSWNQGRL